MPLILEKPGTELMTPSIIQIRNLSVNFKTSESTVTAVDDISFDIPKGKSRGDHIKLETGVWKPIHNEKIERDEMEGWVLVDLLMPFGSDMPYQNATIDIYTDMNQYLTSLFPTSFVEELYPGKDINALLKETREASDLVCFMR